MYRRGAIDKDGAARASLLEERAMYSREDPYMRNTLGLKERRFARELATFFSAGRTLVIRGKKVPDVAFPASEVEGMDRIVVGAIMEDTVQGLQAINIEIEESKKILEKLANEVRAVAELVYPQLVQQAKDLRNARMTVVHEVHDSLQALRDVRKFFLEDDYKTEVAHLERFVQLCKEIQSLKQAGVFDAVCDTAIHLAIHEKKGSG